MSNRDPGHLVEMKSRLSRYLTRPDGSVPLKAGSAR
jgi:hypothetical protein